MLSKYSKNVKTMYPRRENSDHPKVGSMKHNRFAVFTVICQTTLRHKLNLGF